MKRQTNNSAVHAAFYPDVVVVKYKKRSMSLRNKGVAIMLDVR